LGVAQNGHDGLSLKLVCHVCFPCLSWLSSFLLVKEAVAGW
jgi:hypothetical protein